MPRAEHGLYNRADCLRWFTRPLENELEEIKASQSGGLKYEQARATRALSDLRELEFTRLCAQFILIELFQNERAAMCVRVKERCALLLDIASALVGQSRLLVKEALRVYCGIHYLRREIEAAQTSTSLEFEQTRVQRATADLREREILIQRSLMLPIQTYKDEISTAYLTFKQNFLSLPAAFSPQLEGASLAQIQDLLSQKVEMVVAPLSIQDSGRVTPGEDLPRASGGAMPASAPAAQQRAAGKKASIKNKRQAANQKGKGGNRKK
jgi:hypothetical protein